MKTRLYIKFVSVVAVVLLSFVSCSVDKFPSVPVDFVYVNATDSESLVAILIYDSVEAFNDYEADAVYMIDPGSSLILTVTDDVEVNGSEIPFFSSVYIRILEDGNVVAEYEHGDINSPYDINAYALSSDGTLTYTYVFK